MSWLINIWYHLTGRGKFATPLSRLVERDDAPDIYIPRMTPPSK
jgi:hypothetical protein